MKQSTTAIVWPRRPLLGDPLRQKFATALIEMMKGSVQDSHMVAAKVFGRDAKTKLPKDVATIRAYCTGAKFPNPVTAKKLAQCFDVPLDRLLNPKGKLIVHAAFTNGKEPPPPPPLELPNGAPLLKANLETFPKDARFAVVNITGTCPIDVGLHIIAMLHPKLP